MHPGGQLTQQRKSRAEEPLTSRGTNQLSEGDGSLEVSRKTFLIPSSQLKDYRRGVHLDRQSQLTSVALSGKVEFTEVISMTEDGVANATRKLAVRNTSSGQRMNVSLLQHDIKSHVTIIKTNACVYCQRVAGYEGLVHAQTSRRPRS